MTALRITCNSNPMDRNASILPMDPEQERFWRLRKLHKHHRINHAAK